MPESRLDALLDLLADEVAERLKDRATTPPPRPAARPTPQRPTPKPAPRPEPEPEPELGPLPPSQPHTARLLRRLMLGLFLLVILINIPLTSHGTTLATAMPDRASLVIRDGLVIKEETSPQVYIYQDGHFRWISSLDAFAHLGLTWDDVHIVEDGFLDHYEIGTPIHVLLKCYDSPHIYRLENGVKHWIVDIATFEAEGHVWEDVRFVSCEYLRSIPDGETIPPGNGPPPQP